MNKNFRNYSIGWALVLALFNVICFVSPDETEIAGVEYDKFGGAFMVGYIFITLAFVGQLICAFFAFKDNSARKLFYNIPLITISYCGLVATLLTGTLCMVIPDLPNWIGIIACIIILTFTAIAVLKASSASEIVSDLDDKIKNKTQFVKILSSDAQAIVARASESEAKAAAKKVYKAVRYSDPMSNDALSVIEAKITVKLDEFSSAVSENNTSRINALANEILVLLSDRNNKCKALK